MTKKEFWIKLFQENDTALACAIHLCERFVDEKSLQSGADFIAQKRSELNNEVPSEIITDVFAIKKPMKTNLDKIKEKIQLMNIDELIEYFGGDCCENLVCEEISEQEGECWKNGPKYRQDHNCGRCVKNFLLSNVEEAN